LSVAKFHAESAFDDHKHLVFIFVMVEDEFAFKLIELDLLSVEFGHDVGLPVFAYLSELLGDVGLLHKIPLANYIVRCFSGLYCETLLNLGSRETRLPCFFSGYIRPPL
jgi:hypothetical protein